MEFKKEDLIELAWDGSETLEVVQNKPTDKRRWETTHKVIFRVKETGKLYETYYSVGNTEMQETSPYEYEPDLIDCKEVEAYEKTVIAYRHKEAK